MSKVISGLNQEIDRFKFTPFSEAAKLTIIEDYLQSGLSKAAIWKKYTGRIGDHGLIGRWMRQYGYCLVLKKVYRLILIFLVKS